MTRAARLSAAVVVLLLSAACSGGGPPPSGSSPSASAVPVVTTDVRFAGSAPDLVAWSDPLLDVYAPGAGDGHPLVVLLPPHGLTKDGAVYQALATELAGAGAVAVVANWTQLEDPPETFTDPQALRAVAELDRSVAACAISFAVQHAGDYGADPQRLVVVGELFGANTAGMTVLGDPGPLPGCEASAPWTAAGLVAINTDWLIGYPAFDAVAEAAVQQLSPWSLLGAEPGTRTVLVVTDAAVAVTPRCGGGDAEWLVVRDPSGEIRAGLEAVGALADGCADLGEAAAAAAARRSELGGAAEVVRLPNDDGGTASDPGAHLLALGDSDMASLVAAILAAAP